MLLTLWQDFGENPFLFQHDNAHIFGINLNIKPVLIEHHPTNALLTAIPTATLQNLVEGPRREVYMS